MASHMTIGHFLITLNLSDYATRAASVYNYTRREYLPIRRALMSHFPNCVGNDKRDCQDPLIKCFDRRLRKAKTMARKITDMSRTASWEEPIENPLDDSEMVKSIRGDIIREERAILMIIAALVAVAAVGTGVGLGAYATYQVNQQAEELRNLQQQINIMKAKDERIERTVVIHNRTLQQFEKRFNDTFKITYQLANETQSIRDVRYLTNRLILHFGESDDTLRNIRDELLDIKSNLEKRKCSEYILNSTEVKWAFGNYSRSAHRRDLMPIIDEAVEILRLPVSFIRLNHSILVDIGIPAIDNSTLLEILRWLPFPLLETKDRLVIPFPHEEVIAINNKTSMHTTMPLSRLEQCRQYKGVLVCQDLYALTNDMSSSCLSALYEQEVNTIMGLCPLRTTKPKLLTAQLTAEVFLVYSPATIGRRLHPIECPHGFNLSVFTEGEKMPSYLTTTTGYVKIRVPQGCRARLDHGDDKSQTLIWSNPTIVQRINHTAPPIEDIRNMSLLKTVHTPPTAVWKALQNFYVDPEEIDDIRSYLHVTSLESEWDRSMADQRENNRWINTWWKPTTWSSLGITVAIVVILSIAACCYCCWPQRPLSTQGRTDSQININFGNQHHHDPVPTGASMRAPTPFVQVPALRRTASNRTRSWASEAAYNPPPYQHDVENNKTYV